MRLNEVFPDGGIFPLLSERLTDPFFSSALLEALDLEYFYNHSCKKEVSPIVKHYYRLNDGLMSDDSKSALANLIFYHFGKNWDHLAATMSLSYNPLENYNMTETETPDLKRERTPNLTRTETPDLTDVTSRSISQNLIESVGDDSKESVYGFNSTGAVPSTSGENNRTRTVTMSPASNVEDTTTTQTGSRQWIESGTEVTTESGQRLLERSGNIGVTSSQELIESERTLWDWNIVNIIFQNVDEILTAKFYKIRRNEDE